MLNHLASLLSDLWQLFSSSPLWVLGGSGFLSATLLPGSSEAAFIATLSLHQYSLYIVILVATIGNTLGGLTNYWIGLWLPNRAVHHQGHRVMNWLNRYGYWALLLSWLPVVGDPLCLAAGWLKMRFGPALLMIALGKAARYLLLALVFNGFF